MIHSTAGSGSVELDLEDDSVPFVFLVSNTPETNWRGEERPRSGVVICANVPHVASTPRERERPMTGLLTASSYSCTGTQGCPPFCRLVSNVNVWRSRSQAQLNQKIIWGAEVCQLTVTHVPTVVSCLLVDVRRCISDSGVPLHGPSPLPPRTSPATKSSPPSEFEAGLQPTWSRARAVSSELLALRIATYTGIL